VSGNSPQEIFVPKRRKIGGKIFEYDIEINFVNY
jgi:hypothetical protein